MRVGGGCSYLWSPGGETTAAITVSAGGNYSVVGTDASGCQNSASQSVTVNALPTVSIAAGGPTSFCQGGSVTLTAGGGRRYLWSPGGGGGGADPGRCGRELQRGGDRRQRLPE